eukprot:4287535-Pleurochrysis_carterae.AAC.1
MAKGTVPSPPCRQVASPFAASHAPMSNVAFAAMPITYSPFSRNLYLLFESYLTGRLVISTTACTHLLASTYLRL